MGLLTGFMLAQIPKIKGGYGPAYSQLSRELPQEGKNLVLAMQSHSPQTT